MHSRWTGATGVILILIALVLNTLGPRLFPTAFWGQTNPNGMIGPGMISGGMMFGMLGSGMIGGEVAGDPSQSFDQRFLDQMIMHHQGAVMSAQMMIADSARPELRDLAQRIITAQQREIDQMLDWRKEWFGSRTLGVVESEVLGVPEDALGMKHDTAEQVARAADVDATFAALMIPHHEGAIAMAESATRRGQHNELRDLAARIIDAQEREIEVMEPHASGEHHG